MITSITANNFTKVKYLDELDNGGTKTNEGGVDLKKDYYDHLVT
jgi:hypothetical protein